MQNTHLAYSCTALPHLALPPQSSGSDVTVVAFLIFPTKTNSFNVESLRGHAITKVIT